MKLTLSNAVLIMFSIITLVIATSQFYVNYIFQKEQLDLSIDRLSKQSIRMAVGQIDLWLTENRYLLESIFGFDRNQKQELIKDLNRVRDSGQFIAGFVGLNNGDVIGDNKVKFPPGYDPRVRPWYKLALTAKEAVYTEPYEDAFTNAIVITIAQQLFGPGYSGVIGGDLTLGTVDQVMDGVVSDITSGALITQEGTVISYIDKELLLKNATEIHPNFTKDYFDFLVGDSQNQESKTIIIDGVEKFMMVGKVSGCNWYVVLFIDKYLSYEPLRTLVWQTTIATMIKLCFVVGIMFFFIKKLLAPLIVTNAAIIKLSHGDGDLTARLPVNGYDEIAELGSRVNSFISKLHGIISEIVSSGTKLQDKAANFKNISEETKKGLAEQQHEISLIAAAVHQMSATAQEVASNAEATAAATIQSGEHCEEGKNVILKNQDSINSLATQIDSTSQAIAELEANTQNINQILSTIQEIAEQTNLLALNAAIEAARAGEQGRGFAVVADEVRVLSQRTHGSTEEIRAMIETLLENTEGAVITMQKSLELATTSVDEANNATQALEEISISIQQISDMSTQIANAAEEQRSVTEEVSRNIQSVSQVSDELVISGQIIVDKSQNLDGLSGNLNEQVGKFKL